MPVTKKFSLVDAIAAGIKTRETVIVMLRTDAANLAKAIAEANKRRTILAPVPSASAQLDPTLAALLGKYSGVKPAAKTAPDLSEQIEEGIQLLNWLDKIIEVAETGKLALQAGSSAKPASTRTPAQAMTETLQVEVVPEEIEALVRTEKDRGQLTVDTVLRRLERGLENSGWMGRFWAARPDGITKFEQLLDWIVSHRDAKTSVAATTSGNGDVWKTVAGFIGYKGDSDGTFPKQKVVFELTKKVVAANRVPALEKELAEAKTAAKTSNSDPKLQAVVDAAKSFTGKESLDDVIKELGG